MGKKRKTQFHRQEKSIKIETLFLRKLAFPLTRLIFFSRIQRVIIFPSHLHHCFPKRNKKSLRVKRLTKENDTWKSKREDREERISILLRRCRWSQERGVDYLARRWNGKVLRVGEQRRGWRILSVRGKEKEI